MIADRGNLDTTRSTPGGTARRRGNTMVLVVGILVLLAIIATSYLTRTHAGRVTAISQQRASLRDDSVAGRRTVGQAVEPRERATLRKCADQLDQGVLRGRLFHCLFFVRHHITSFTR